MVSAGNSLDSLAYVPCRSSIPGNETATRLGLCAREAGMRMDTFQVSSWASGKILPNRTMIRQKHIPTIGLDCEDLTR